MSEIRVHFVEQPSIFFILSLEVHPFLHYIQHAKTICWFETGIPFKCGHKYEEQKKGLHLRSELFTCQGGNIDYAAVYGNYCALSFHEENQRRTNRRAVGDNFIDLVRFPLKGILIL